MFEHVETYAGDPILSLTESFNQDIRPDKVNMGIGVYYNDQGCIPIMRAVKIAEHNLAQSPSPYNYLPMEGIAAYRMAVQRLIFGERHPALIAERVATIQSIGGSGALRIGADFLKRYFPTSQVWVSDPTWENHVAIFENAGFTVNRYPYFDRSLGGVNINALLNCLNDLTPHSIVILHPCCHNPTGSDLTAEQWDQIIALVNERQLIPFIDTAYQGFGNTLDDDAYAIRAMAKSGSAFLVSNSFSKIFSLYGKRCGGLSIVTGSRAEAERVLGQLKLTVRRHYSSPPTHGARLITTVLTDPTLYTMWKDEVEEMRLRIKEMRQSLVDILTAELPHADFSHILKQQGMFSYTGFSPEQVTALREQFAIYLVNSGRMCVAGLNQRNVERVGKAFAKVYA